jgi:hypothetical protein
MMNAAGQLIVGNLVNPQQQQVTGGLPQRYDKRVHSCMLSYDSLHNAKHLRNALLHRKTKFNVFVFNS